jgi:hypothetical protein
LTPWDRLKIAISAHEDAKARVLVAEQFAQLSAAKTEALEAARREERRQAGFLAMAQAEVDRLAGEAEERRRLLSQIVPPDRGDWETLRALDVLERRVNPTCWDQGAGPELLRHVAWLRDLRRRGFTVEDWITRRCP